MLPFSGPPLTPGKLQKRYKRFFADVTLADGTTVTAHCPNTGSMKSCLTEGAPVYLSTSDNPKRKLRYTWELVQIGDGFIGVNTARPNHLVEAAILSGAIKEFSGVKRVQKEWSFTKKTRFDLLVEDDFGTCAVEVKNVTFFDRGVLAFPDAVTSRGKKHMEELVLAKKQVGRAMLIFVANRPESTSVTAASWIDPEYAESLQLAKAAGVEVVAYRAHHSLEKSWIGESLPVE